MALTKRQIQQIEMACLVSEGMWCLAQYGVAEDAEDKREWMAKAMWYAAEACRVDEVGLWP